MTKTRGWPGVMSGNGYCTAIIPHATWYSRCRRRVADNQTRCWQHREPPGWRPARPRSSEEG